MNAVPAGLRADVKDREAGFLGSRREDAFALGQTDRHRVDQDIAVIALVEIGLAAHRRHAHAIAIAANARDDTGDELAGLGMIRCAKAQRIHQGHGPCAHGEHIAQNAAHARSRTLIGLDIGGVVVALHLEDSDIAIINIDHARILAGAVNDALAGHGEFLQVHPARLVGAML